jgi:ABC-type uncharacterized transport system auxiliary subunit
MKILKTGTLIILSTIIISAAGCGKQEFSKQRYWLDLQRPQQRLNTSNEAVLSVEPFSIESPFRTQSIIYKKGAFEYETDFYKEYLTPPAKMVTEQTRKWLANSGLFSRVLKPGSIMKSTHILEGHVSKAYLDASSAGRSYATLEISMYLLKQNEDDQEILFGKTYLAEEFLKAKQSQDYFEALEKSLTKIMVQFENDIVQKI